MGYNQKIITNGILSMKRLDCCSKYNKKAKVFYGAKIEDEETLNEKPGKRDLFDPVFSFFFDF